MWKSLIKLKVRGVEQDFMPNMGQLKLTNAPVEGCIIDPNVYGLPDHPCNVR